MVLNDYLVSRGWKPNKDGTLKGKEFLQKTTKSGSLPLVDDNFRNLGKPQETHPLQLNDNFSEFFSKQGYAIMPSKSVVNGGGDTLFIGAGLQPFYSQRVADGREKKVIISQPSIRINALEKMHRNGYSTAFVNICTEQSDVSAEQHAANLENWFSFLSSIGIYIGHLKLVKDPEWEGGSNMKGDSLLIYYGGLQLGDAVFVECQNGGRDKFNISDIGFGLERILWAKLKTDRYYEAIGPAYELFTQGVMPLDTVRTMSLMTLAGVSPSNNEQGYRLKQFARKYLDNSKDLIPAGLIEYYSNFWDKFTQLPITVSQAQNALRAVLEKQAILKMASDLKISGISSEISDMPNFIAACRAKAPGKIKEIESYLIGKNSGENIC